MPRFFMSVRDVKDGAFSTEPDLARRMRYLVVPDGHTPAPAHDVKFGPWAKALIDRFQTQTDIPPDRHTRIVGDIVIFVHGFNTSVEGAAGLHDVIQRHLDAAAAREVPGVIHLNPFDPVVVTFLWPSEGVPLGYLEDRHDAKQIALRLVSDGLKQMRAFQTSLNQPSAKRRCEVNIHILGHSMGCYIVREAFADADDARYTGDWTANQVAFVAADVSAPSMSASDARSRGLYRMAGRLTNYYSGYDTALQVSNAKRVGLSPRLGRHGLPRDAPSKAVDVDCSEHYDKNRDKLEKNIGSSHGWYFQDEVFMSDLCETLKGYVDRRVLKTRAPKPDGDGFVLK